jgi:hypothetical protein
VSARLHGQEDFEIILVFEDWPEVFGLPDVDDSITDNASIATCGSGAERVVVIDVEAVWETLHDQPRLVCGQNWTGTVGLSNVKGTCLSPNRSVRNLRNNEDEEMFKERV